MANQEEHKQIIIVRRRSNADEGHHGGVWKIAFADFMTAMMAFFLVLWIVNSTSKETQASIARYFNPIKISDTTPAPRGMQNPKATDYDASFVENVKEIHRAQSLENLMKIDTPVDVAAQVKANHVASPPGEESTSLTRSRALERIESLISRNGEATINAIIDLVLDKERFASADIVSERAEIRRQEESVDVSLGAMLSTSDNVRGDISRRGAPLPGDGAQAARDTQINEIARSLQEVIKQLPASASLNSTLKVDESRGEIILSILESQSLNMFARGSAVPLPAAVDFVGSVGSAIKGLRLAVVVRGHTDSMRHRRGVSDNWKLSTDRALSAFYILKRFGVAEQSIRRIEGVADRELKNPQSPFADENRRIDIVLMIP